MKISYLNRKSNQQHGNTWREGWDLVNNVIFSVLQNPLFMSRFNKSVFKATTGTDERVNMTVFCDFGGKVLFIHCLLIEERQK